MAKFEKIERLDDLNTGREKLNNAIDGSEQAVNDSSEALTKANTSLNQSNVTQNQLDNIIIESGTSDAETIQARGDHPLLKDRLNSTDEQLAETDQYRRFESMVNRKLSKVPAFLIVDDDGDEGFYKVLFKLAKEYNIPITSAMITGDAMSFPGDDRPQNQKRYNYEQIMEMYYSGLVEFVPHGHDHINYVNASDEEIIEDFEESINFMNKHPIFNERCIVYPFGGYDERVLNLAKQYFDYSTGSGGVRDVDKRIVTPPVNNYRLGRFRTDNPIHTIKEEIDKTFDLNGLLVFISHADQDTFKGEAHYREIIEYVLSKGGKFVTLEQGVRMHGNIAEFGGSAMEPATTISPDNRVNSNVLGRVVIDNSRDVTGNTSLYHFKPNAITVSKIRSRELEGFPDKGHTSGTAITYRDSEEIWNYQLFISTRTKKIYRRWWDEEANTPNWTDFELENTFVFLGRNKATPSSRPDDSLFTRRITQTLITSAGNEGFPGNKSGMLTTYGLYGDDDTSYRTYDVYDSQNSFIQFWDSYDKEWKDWQIKGGTLINGNNEIRHSKKPSEFYIGRTLDVVTSGNPDSNLFPAVGTVETIKSAENRFGRYCRQFLYSTNNNMYFRNLKTDGGDDFTGWVKVLTEEV